MSIRLEDMETEGLAEYKANLERNCEIMRQALQKEEATLKAVELELEVRRRAEV